MKPSEILNALGQHLTGMPDCPPVIWPNKKQDPLPAKPYLVLQMASRRRVDPTLNGTSGNWVGTLSITVVWEKNTYSTQPDDLAENIRARFEKAVNAGGVRIFHSEALVGFPTDTDFRVPVSIDWTT